MAGDGARFKFAGFEKCKPLINVEGSPMVIRAIETLNIKANYIFIIRDGDDRPEIEKVLSDNIDNPTIICVDYLTGGPACTALLAKDIINNDDPLVIANCDQIIIWDSELFSGFARRSNLDGIIMTYNSENKHNSYVRIGDDGFVAEVKEKEVISSIATNGIHYWKHGFDFVESAESMIAKNDFSINGEYYVAPTYNYLISKGKKIGTYHLESGHYPIGTPEDLSRYINR